MVITKLPGSLRMRWNLLGAARGSSLAFSCAGDHTDIRIALGARLFYVDVSVVHPTAASYIPTSSRRILATAAAAERRKDAKYLQRAAAENAEFVPFIVESFGGFGNKARCLCPHWLSALVPIRCQEPATARDSRRPLDAELADDERSPS